MNSQTAERYRVKALQKFHDQPNLQANFPHIHLRNKDQAIAKQHMSTGEEIHNKNAHQKLYHLTTILMTEWEFLKQQAAHRNKGGPVTTWNWKTP